MPGMMEKGPELLGKNRSANGGAKSPAGGGGGGGSSANGGLHFSEPESGCSSDDEHGGTSPRSLPRPPGPLPAPSSPRSRAAAAGTPGAAAARDPRLPAPTRPRPRPRSRGWRASCLAFPRASPYLLSFYHISWHCFADVGMRVGAEYQARIPEFDPGRYICSQENPVSLALPFFFPGLLWGGRLRNGGVTDAGVGSTERGPGRAGHGRAGHRGLGG